MACLASRLDLIAPSPTLALDAKAKALKASGHDVISFGVGEPDFNTPEHIRRAALKAIDEGFTRYTAADGIMELKEAVCRKFQRDNGLNYEPSQVVISNGGKHCLYNIFLTLFGPGDEVIIPAPYWVSYPPLAILAGAKPVIVHTKAENGYCLTAEELRAHLSPRTRGLILNSPSNPSGLAYGPKELGKLAALILEKDLWVVSDDIYEKIVFDGFKFHNLPMVEPKLYERTVIAHGLSKTYAMTGWRIGFLAGPQAVARAAAKIQSQTTSNPCSISQKAALAALDGSQDSVRDMVASFQKRRDLVLELLANIDGLICPKPQGAFYVFPKVSSYFGRRTGGREIKSCDELADYLLERAGTAVVPGSGFGDSETLRLSYALGEADIRRGLQRIKEALAELS